MADEIQNLILQVKGTEEAKELRAVLQAEETTLVALNEVMRQNGALTTAQAVQQRTTATAMVQHRKELQDLEKALGGAASGGTRLNTTVQQLGYGLGDLMQTSGGLGQRLMSVTNNIQFALAGFGAWGIAVGVALTVVASVIRNVEGEFKHFTETVDYSKTRVEALEKQIEELSAKPNKLAIDVADLERAKAEVAAIKADMAAADEWARLHTDWQKKSAGEVGAVLGQAPGGARASEAKVEAAIRADVERSNAPLREARERVTAIQERIKELQAVSFRTASQEADLRAAAGRLPEALERSRLAYGAVGQEARQKAGELYRKSTEGDQLKQQELAERLRQTGQHVLAGRLAAVSPEMLKQASDFHQQLENSKEIAKNEEEQRQKAEELRRAQKEFHLAVPEWQAMSPQRRRSFQGATEAERFRAFGEARAAGVMAEPEQPGVLPFKPGAREREIARTPAEQEKYEAEQREINRQGQAKPLFRPVSPEAQATDQARSQVIRAQRENMQGLQPAAQATIGYMEQLQKDNAEMRNYIQSIGAAAAQQQRNFRLMQGPMNGQGYGGPFGGDFSW